MSNIKVIKDFEIWEVMRRVTEGAHWAYLSKQTWYRPNDGTDIKRMCEFIASGSDVAIIDTSTPEIDWDEFDWGFFNQYGGLLVKVSGGGIDFAATSAEHAALSMSKAELRESPFYYWAGGDLPVPANVEVEYVFRNGKDIAASPAGEMRWTHIFGEGDIIGFKITGKTL